MTPRDAVFVYDEFERHPSNIVAVYAFDATAPEATPPESDAVRAWVRARIGHFPRSRQRLARVPWDLDLPYWVPDRDFALDRHVASSEPGLTWDDARERIAEIAAARMDLDRPPWRVDVFARVRGVPGAPGDTATLVVVRFHHSAGDGVATRALESKLFDAGAEIPAGAADTGRAWSAPRAVARAVAVQPYRLARFAIGLRRTGLAAVEVRKRAAAGLIHEPPACRPATRFNRRVDPVFGFDLVRIPLSSVLRAKAAAPERVTVNDLILAVVSGALRTLLAELEETPPSALAAMVPRSMRGVAQWDSANQLVQLSVDLHTDLADPVARLLAIRESARREKERSADEAVQGRESRVQTSPAWLLRLAGWARARRVFDELDTVPLSNTTVSNVPPVAERLEFLGAPMICAFGALPIMDGDGLRQVTTSQGDELIIAFSADKTMMPSTRHYGELLLRSFDQLCVALESAEAERVLEHRP
ncbi:wax ester/triacylglycerol synthase domain-containing protein [Nocardia sp. NPDC088792]|uniref:wax ester/triacylglycerol synthase domain-containing protein n=1 Tax=Nocardia sp. NPDC088792 TaxID=3364332 RepID=UPI00381C13B4